MARFLLAPAFLVALFAAVAPAAAQNDAELAVRIDRLEAQVRSLTGMVETLTFRVQQLEQIIALLAAEGIEGLEIPMDGPLPDAGLPGAAPVAPAASLAPNPVAESPGALAVPPPQPGQPAGAPLPDVPGQPLDLSSVLRGDGVSVGGAPLVPEAAALLTTGNAQADYERVYERLVALDYAGAEEGFRAFIAAYPGNPLVADATFWIGESLYARADYLGAAEAFLDAFNLGRDGPKAAETLLKLGMALAGLGQTATACSTFAQVTSQYPNSSNALRQRVQEEQARAAC